MAAPCPDHTHFRTYPHIYSCEKNKGFIVARAWEDLGASPCFRAAVFLLDRCATRISHAYAKHRLSWTPCLGQVIVVHIRGQPLYDKLAFSFFQHKVSNANNHSRLPCWQQRCLSGAVLARSDSAIVTCSPFPFPSSQTPGYGLKAATSMINT